MSRVRLCRQVETRAACFHRTIDKSVFVLGDEESTTREQVNAT